MRRQIGAVPFFVLTFCLGEAPGLGGGLGADPRVHPTRWGRSADYRAVVISSPLAEPATPGPKWRGGRLVSWRAETTAADARDNLAVHDRAGQIVKRMRVWYSGASMLKIHDATAADDGAVAVVGAVVTGSGAKHFLAVAEVVWAGDVARE